jgi:hypothetical protein
MIDTFLMEFSFIVINVVCHIKGRRSEHLDVCGKHDSAWGKIHDVKLVLIINFN